MYRTLVLAAFLFLPTLSNAQTCDVPAFEAFAVPDASGSSEKPALPLDMHPVAQLRIPTGFSRIGALPGGSVGFGQHQAGMSVHLGFETRESISIHQQSVAPAEFLLAIFKGLNPDGCRYLAHYQLESQVGKGPKPTLSSTITFQYKGTFMDNGSVFDQSSSPVVSPLSQLIRGWQAVFPLMPKGTKATLYVPSSLGYGPSGYAPDIPPNANLIFEVELVDCKD